jgi:hypothetical protein
MHPLPPFLIMKINIINIKIKNKRGKIHQKLCSCGECHHGHEFGCTGVCSAANTNDEQASMSKEE